MRPTRWQDPEWQAAELAAFEAEVAYLRADAEEGMRRATIAEAALALAEARHRVELLRIDDLGSYPGRSRWTARRWKQAEELRERLRLAEAQLVRAHDIYSRLLGQGPRHDVVALLKAAHAAGRVADERVRLVERGGDEVSGG